jgi:ferrochelatase
VSDLLKDKNRIFRYHITINLEVNMARGLLLLNMGGPNTIGEVALFLRNMFADPRILPMHPFLRRMIGKRILKKRLNEAEENYRQLGGKSPLTEITQSLAEKVETLTGISTRLAMRYVPPFASEALAEFQEQGIDEIIVFPMYPQYSTTTTLSSIDDLQKQMEKLGYAPTMKVIDPYYDDPYYARIMGDRIVEALGSDDPRQYDLILSAHGLPMSIVRAGDPYPEQVEQSRVRVEESLESRGVHFRRVVLAYQSKVGSGAWLEPSLVDVLRRPRNLRVLLFPLAFTIDNSETLFELEIEHRQIAEKIGYEDYRVAACPNDGDDFAAYIAGKVDASIA